MSTGEYLCWDYSTHAGCAEKNTERTKGKHEHMSIFGLNGPFWRNSIAVEDIEVAERVALKR